MEQTQDKLVNSPVCDSNACYESEFMTADGPIKTWLCMTSGYTSNTTMTLDSEALKQTLELTAEMIKDLRLDLVPPGGGEKLAWFPTAITMPDKGMIFPEPLKDTEKFDWGWTVVKAIPIPEDEQHKYPDATNPGKFYKNKMDMKNLKRYDKLCFMDAAEELGMFAKPVESNED
jgi:hypothetical protein|tara:strand:+ start:593 stop:1114 length:522 start_codon:yes stop_codon:yes gene_type:complete